MATPAQAPLPQDLVIGANWTIAFDAIDPATGASVGGVTISDASLTATNQKSGKQVQVTTGPYLLVGGPNA